MLEVLDAERRRVNKVRMSRAPAAHADAIEHAEEKTRSV
jgi:hypothetical protein